MSDRVTSDDIVRTLSNIQFAASIYLSAAEFAARLADEAQVHGRERGWSPSHGHIYEAGRDACRQACDGIAAARAYAKHIYNVLPPQEPKTQNQVYVYLQSLEGTYNQVGKVMERVLRGLTEEDVASESPEER